MKWCTRILITDMLPNGTATQVNLQDVSLVDDAHEFGFQQKAESVRSPVTGLPIIVFYPELHIKATNSLWLLPC